MSDLISLLIVDASPFVRPVLRELLSRDPKLEALGATGELADVERLVNRLHPQVLIWGLQPRDPAGEFVLGRLLARDMPRVVIMVEPAADPRLVGKRYLQAGAVTVLVRPPLNMHALPPEQVACLHCHIRAAAYLQPRHWVPLLPLV